MKPRWKVLIGAAALAAVLGAAAALYASRRPRFDMKATLASIADREGVWDNQWDQPEEKIANLSAALKSETDPSRRFQLKREIARHYLYAGKAEGAIATLESVQKEFAGSMPPEAAEAIKADLAFAWFRMGEVANCAQHHNAESCLLPIQGKGVHTQRAGATESVRLYGELLSDPKIEEDNALMYRWLMNIGYMTLGQYPDKVPPRWLIPPEAFKSDADIGKFPDVAAERGVAEFGHAGGVILEDFDNDGHLDLMISHMGVRDQLEYFHNDGTGHFVRMTEQAGLKGIVGGLNMVQVDYDNDGCIDVFLPRGAWLHDHGQWPRSLLRNNCDGTFTDVTAKAGLLGFYPTQAVTWADVDGDGWMDLFIGNEINRENVQWPESTPDFHLYMNNRDGTFREVSARSGIKVEGMIKAATWGDYDNDGRPDLFVSVLGKPKRLFHNLGRSVDGVPQFEDVSEKAGIREPIMSFTCWFFDYDNDGWQDIFVSGYSATLPNIVREVWGRRTRRRASGPGCITTTRMGRSPTSRGRSGSTSCS